MAPFRVLVLCTGNSCRSLMAESILARDGAGRVQGLSAGSRPTGAPNPHALALLAKLGYPTAGLSSKSWDAFAAPGAPPIDLAITVCDDAAGEECPHFAGAPLQVHWGVPDPARFEGPPAQREALFTRVFAMLKSRLEALVALPLATMGRAELEQTLRIIDAEHRAHEAEAPAA